ncbi:MAG: hypothetical protein ACJ75R_04975 [Solirubrobacterales bacterium]
MSQLRRFAVAASVAAAFAALSAPGAVRAKESPEFEKTVQVPTARGGVLGPGGGVRYTTLYGDARGTALLKIDSDGGQINRERWFEDPWTLPAVTISGAAGGLSADGRTLVLFRPDYSATADATEFQVLNPATLGTRDRFTLPGRFGFDAISPDGERIYLVEYKDPRDPFDYAIRALDVDSGRLDPREVIDPSEPDEQMAGQPVARRMSPDGRWAYTLYAGGKEAFIHALDTERSTAVCVDLDQFSPGDAYGLKLGVDPRSGAVIVRQQNVPVASVDPASFDVTDIRARPTGLGPSPEADAGSDWLGPAALAAGIALLAGACVLVFRRQRRAAA